MGSADDEGSGVFSVGWVGLCRRVGARAPKDEPESDAHGGRDGGAQGEQKRKDGIGREGRIWFGGGGECDLVSFGKAVWRRVCFVFGGER